MASILEFRLPAFRLQPLSAQPAGHGTADIVLFPGVRYERAAPDAASEKPRARRMRRRDRLDLDD